MVDKKFQQYINGLSFLTGAVRYHDLCYVLALDDEAVEQNAEHAIVMELDRGQWGAELKPVSYTTTAPSFHPKEKNIFLSTKGKIYQMGQGIFEDSQIPQAPDDTRPFFFKEINCIANGKAYAVGPCRICYRRDDTEVWTRIDHGAQTDDMDLMDSGFSSIDGFSDDDIYTAGWGGELWHYDSTCCTRFLK